tara:strand:- start:41 stop:781 length:741 start_codon:yes stop_codon:yes gene_type:complete
MNHQLLSLALLGLLCQVTWCPVARALEEPNPVKAVSPEPRKAAWWTKRHDAKIAALKKQDRVDLLMIGDSITHSWESKGKKTWAEYYADRNAFNIGYSGDRTEHVIWRLQHGEIDGISPKLAVIMIGTNNTGHRQDPPKDTAAGIKAILAILKKKLPKTKILLLGVFPRGATRDDKLRKINVGINQIIKSFADGQRVHFLDLSSTFLDDKGNLPKSVMPDLLHPNEDGYGMWAKAQEPMIKKLLGE